MREKLLVVFPYVSNMSWTIEMFEKIKEIEKEWFDVYVVKRLKDKAWELSIDSCIPNDYLGYFFFDANAFNIHDWLLGLYPHKSFFKPFIFTYWHGGFHEPFDYEREVTSSKWIDEMKMKSSDLVFVQSYWHKRMIEEMYGRLDIVTAPLYISPKKKTNKQKEGIGFVSRYTFGKGVDLLWPEVVKFRSSDRNEYLSFLESKKVIVFPARKETFGLSIMETIQMGTIPVVSYSRIYIEIYGSKLLSRIGVKELTSEKFREKAKEIINLPEDDYKELNEKLYQRIKKFENFDYVFSSIFSPIKKYMEARGCEF